MKLDDLIASARTEDTAWSEDRSRAVLGATLKKRERVARRDRMVRRGLIGASSVASVVFVLLRAASADQGVSTSEPREPQQIVVASESLANGDGGYSRD